MVFHVLCLFIVPCQILTLGDPSRRSCDACESVGAMLQKVVKHLTCRRNVREAGTAHSGANGKVWTQTFTREYTEQAFRRTCVRAGMIHGAANKPYTQRKDKRLKTTGTRTSQAIHQRPQAQSFCLAGNGH